MNSAYTHAAAPLPEPQHLTPGLAWIRHRYEWSLLAAQSGQIESEHLQQAWEVLDTLSDLYLDIGRCQVSRLVAHHLFVRRITCHIQPGALTLECDLFVDVNKRLDAPARRDLRRRLLRETRATLRAMDSRHGARLHVAHMESDNETSMSSDAWFDRFLPPCLRTPSPHGPTLEAAP